MKKIILLAIGFVLLTGTVLAQKETDKSESDGKASKSVYGEIAGNGLLFSANYDMRFKGEKGFGFRVGVGFGASLGVSAVTFPLGLNYLAGKGPHYVEIGMGATYANLTLNWFDDNESAGAFIFVPTLGYRYSPAGKNFTGRVCVGPLVAGGTAYFPWGGISAGFKF